MPTGPSIYRSALLLESAANIGSLIPMFLSPEYVLSYLVRGPSQITPATKSVMQWFSGAIILATVPLVLSYPESESEETVVTKRRLTYAMIAATEVALGGIALAQYVGGDSGMSNGALLTASGMMVSLASLRVFVVYIRPDLMVPQGRTNEKKTR